MTNLLINPGFELPWTNLPPVANNLVNQQPGGWTVHITGPGQPLLNSADLATGYPEIVHKGYFPEIGWTLPADERPGGKNTLILEGVRCLKIFSAGDAFCASLSQTAPNLQPGARAVFTLHVLADLHNLSDPYGCEVFVQAGLESSWFNADFLGHRQWRLLEIETFVPPNGALDLLFACKSKWKRKIDFFFDNLSLILEPDPQNPGQPQPPIVDTPVYLVSRHIINVFSDGTSIHQVLNP